MGNARSPSQIPVKRQISVEGDTSDLCNNTTAAQPRTPKIQAVRLQNYYAETLWNKHNVTIQVQLHTLAPGCCWGNIHVQMYVLNP